LWGFATLFLAMGLHTTGRPWVFRGGNDEASGTTWAGFFGRGRGVTTSPWLRPTALVLPTRRGLGAAGEGATLGLRDADKELVETLERLAARGVLAFATRDELLWNRLLGWRKVTLVPIGLVVRWNERAPFAADEPELIDRLVQTLRLSRDERAASLSPRTGDYRSETPAELESAERSDIDHARRGWEGTLSLVELLTRVDISTEQAERIERTFVRELPSLTATPSFLRRLPQAPTTKALCPPTDEERHALPSGRSAGGSDEQR
jgi:hypothetical protein